MPRWPRPGGHVIVRKLNLRREVVWTYPGRVLSRGAASVTIEALFDRPDQPFQGVVLRRGDRFVETFYTRRWYNVFEVFDLETGQRKGWYGNVCTPAKLDAGGISYIDLALDLWVAADGAQTLLDEDEFRQLGLDARTARKARTAVRELRARFAAGSLS